MKKYKIIYADPPWSFGGGGVYQDAGREVRKTADKYTLTKTKDLCRLDVPAILNEDALCFMWSTDQHIPDAIRLMSEWGFRYCTVAFYWLKQTRLGNPVYNVGCWTMKSVEVCLLGLHGKPMKMKKTRNIKQLILAERKEHSRKPEEAKNRIVQLCGDVPRLEMFCRGSAPGWDVFGNEAENSIEIPIKSAVKYIAQQPHGGNQASLFTQIARTQLRHAKRCVK